MTRRKFCLAAGSMFFSVSTIGCLWPNKSSASQNDSITAEGANLSDRNADDWMKEWKKTSLVNKDLQGPLDLRRFKDPMYILLCPIGWKPKKITQDLSALVVPAGFVTDFASIPRVFWSIFKPDGNYAYAAVLHDYLYWQQDRSRSSADAIFRAAMDDLKITDFQSATLFHAVDLFGESAWESNKKLKSAGERRILSKFPTDPNVTWAEWKSRPDVFVQ